MDQDGYNAADPKFDPGKIKAYGCTLPPLYPMLWSNGGGLASEDGTMFMMNSPESVEVLQKMQDLIWVHHVTPSPQASQSMGLNGIAPTTDVLMETGKLAIDFNGMWKTLDYSHHKDLEWGMGVLPKFLQPVTNRGGTAVTIQSATKFPDAAYEFYRWRYSPERINLYEIGLWMPIEKQYYTDEAKIKQWLDPSKGVYPPEARDVLVTYGAKFAPKQDVGYWVKNLDQIQTEVVTPALTDLWANKGKAKEIMDAAARKAAPMMKGRW